MKRMDQIKVSFTTRTKASSRPKITCSKSAADLLFDIYDSETIAMRESFYVIYLNRNNRVKGYHLHSIGGLDGCIVDIRIILATALKTLSSALIISHNHPSTRLQPSQSDIKITNRLKKAAELMDIKVLDHIIVSPERKYFSFADDGMLS
ncbi:MAG: JAB domain-containing protein [Bacteroidota bacterium]